jgi:hypothetical protein
MNSAGSALDALDEFRIPTGKKHLEYWQVLASGAHAGL